MYYTCILKICLLKHMAYHRYIYILDNSLYILNYRLIFRYIYM